MLIFTVSCNKNEQRPTVALIEPVYLDEPYIQEFHEACNVSENATDNEIRNIASDNDFNVWVATAGGAFQKSQQT